MRYALTLGMVAIVAVGGTTAVAAVVENNNTYVTRVVDGDTIDVRQGDDRFRVRLLNIDAPESVDPDEETECLGPEATAYLRRILPAGTEISLEYDIEREDRYGRVLAGVIKDDQLVNAQIAAAGLGRPVVYPPNKRFYPDVLAAWQQAQHEQVGVFDPGIECTFVHAVLDYRQEAARIAAQAPAEGAAVLDYESYLEKVTTGIAVGTNLIGRAPGDHTFLAWDGNKHLVLQKVRNATSNLLAAEEIVGRRLAAERVRIEAEKKAREAAAKKARAEAERKARAEAERKAAARRAAAQSGGSTLRSGSNRSGGSGSSSGSAARKGSSSGGSTGGSSGGGSSKYTGCRAYAPGGKTWRPIPCP